MWYCTRPGRLLMTRPSPLFFTLSMLVVFASTSALTADQGCDTNEQIYQNSSLSTMVVTGEFTDGCKDADSYVDVYKKGDKPGDTPTVSGTVKDMHTINLTLDVPPGGACTSIVAAPASTFQEVVQAG
jgi:hypothetical protein